MNIKIISEPSKENPFIVLYKPHNLPTAPLSNTESNNALCQAEKLFPEINYVKGKKEIEKGLIHRLDTVTAGLVLIATDQIFYEKMIDIQKNNQFIKYYRAFSDICKDNAYTLGNFPPLNGNFELNQCNDTVYTKSYFRPFGNGSKEVRPVTEFSGPAALKKIGNKVEYETEIKLISNDLKSAELLCSIKKGFRHQVRCHLAWIGYPCKNDPLYNSLTPVSNNEIGFEACGFEFPHPYTGEKIAFRI